MSEINTTVLEKLGKYPAEVAEVAVQAVTLAHRQQSKPAVEEQIKSIIRQVVRNKGNSK